MPNFPNWCCSFPPPVFVACRANFAPQPENLGWPGHFLGLAAHLWGPGVPCWDDFQCLILAGDCFCCRGVVLDDRSAHILSIRTIISILTILSTFNMLSTLSTFTTWSTFILFTFTILSILRPGQFHVYAYQMYVHLLLAHASCLHGFKHCVYCAFKYFRLHLCQPSALAQHNRLPLVTTHRCLIMNPCRPVISLHSSVAYQALNQPSQCGLDAALLWV